MSTILRGEGLGVRFQSFTTTGRYMVMSGEAKPLEGQAVVITGAASGLGLMTAKRLAGIGAKLFLIDIDDSVAEIAHLCRLISEVNYHEPCVDYAVCSVADEQGMQQAINRAAHVMDGIDIVFANAGIGKVVSLEGDLAVVEKTIRVNYLGVVYTVAHALPHIKRSKGYILVNASMGGIVTLPLMGFAYGASKSAVATFGNTVELHLTGTGARCAVLYLAEHNTPMEQEFSHPLAKQLRKDNKLLKYGHKKRDPRNAVDAIIQALEERPLTVHVPGYTRWARYFPGVTNWVIRRLGVRDMYKTNALAEQLNPE